MTTSDLRADLALIRDENGAAFVRQTAARALTALDTAESKLAAVVEALLLIHRGFAESDETGLTALVASARFFADGSALASAAQARDAALRKAERERLQPIIDWWNEERETHHLDSCACFDELPSAACTCSWGMAQQVLIALLSEPSGDTPKETPDD
jgi:hypothetical protein